MLYYDYQKAKEIVKKYAKRAESIGLGMEGDLSWTTETIWENGKYVIDLDKKGLLIGGIDGSYWAAPVAVIDTHDGERILVPCHKDHE